MITGPGVSICDACTQLGIQIMLEETAEPVPRDAACSFCRKTRAEVRVLIHAPAEYVCDECVQLCSEILEATRSLRAAPELPIARVRQKKWWQRWHRRG